MGFFIVMLIILFIPIIMLAVWWAEDWSHGSKDYISFKQFKSFYEINPGRWKLDTCVVGCKKNSYYTNDYIWFKFHLIDFFRYKAYKRIVIRNKKIHASSERYKQMIELVKSDISDFELRTKKEAEDQLNEIWKNSKMR